MKKAIYYLSVAAVLLGSASTATATGVLSKSYASHSNPADTGSELHNRDAAHFSAPITLRGSLVTFNASYGKNFFDIQWNTLPDTHYDHFEIERSLDGIRYEKLGEIKGGAPQPEEYSFRDKLHPYMARGVDLYYRLKQVEEDGQVSYSKVLIARIYHSQSIRALSVTPDPLVNDILVNVQLKESSYVVMKIKDKDGNELISQSLRSDDGMHTYSLEGSSKLKPGTYMLEVTVNSRESMRVQLLKS